MAVEPKAGIGKLQRTKNELHDMLGRSLRRSGFGHLYRMAAVSMSSTADGIRKRPDPTNVQGFAVHPEGWAALTVNLGILCHWRTCQDFCHVTFDVCEFFFAQ